jgi:hypothetical protein
MTLPEQGFPICRAAIRKMKRGALRGRRHGTFAWLVLLGDIRMAPRLKTQRRVVLPTGFGSYLSAIVRFEVALMANALPIEYPDAQTRPEGDGK